MHRLNVALVKTSWNTSLPNKGAVHKMTATNTFKAELRINSYKVILNMRVFVKLELILIH